MTFSIYKPGINSSNPTKLIQEVEVSSNNGKLGRDKEAAAEKLNSKINQELNKPNTDPYQIRAALRLAIETMQKAVNNGGIVPPGHKPPNGDECDIEFYNYLLSTPSTNKALTDLCTHGINPTVAKISDLFHINKSNLHFSTNNLTKAAQNFIDKLETFDQKSVRVTLESINTTQSLIKQKGLQNDPNICAKMKEISILINDMKNSTKPMSIVIKIMQLVNYVDAAIISGKPQSSSPPRGQRA